jgi:hypothetical protein
LPLFCGAALFRVLVSRLPLLRDIFLFVHALFQIFDEVDAARGRQRESDAGYSGGEAGDGERVIGLDGARIGDEWGNDGDGQVAQWQIQERLQSCGYVNLENW